MKFCLHACANYSLYFDSFPASFLGSFLHYILLVFAKVRLCAQITNKCTHAFYILLHSAAIQSKSWQEKVGVKFANYLQQLN